MTTTVTKQMVELYTLGVLSLDGRRLIEAAFDASPQVQEWFLELGELPEHVQAELLRSEWGEQLDQHRLQSAHAADRELLEFAAAHASSTDDPPAQRTSVTEENAAFRRLGELIVAGSRELGGLLAELASLAAGVSRRTMDFTEALAGAPPTAPSYPTGVRGGDHWEQRGELISIKAPVSEIPFGLVWLGLVEANGAVTMHLPRLEKINDHWVGRVAIRDLLDGRCPVSPVETFFIPAQVEKRAAFDCEQVRQFLKELDDDSEQRLAAESLWSNAQEEDD